MKHSPFRTLGLVTLCALPALCPVRAGEKEGKPGGVTLSNATFAGLKARSIGPALMSGRICDFGINPHDWTEYYVAVCSGGVWKTENAGITYTPVFDSQGSYSIGCVTVDPNNPHVVWVGTGENNSQRSVSFGDGVYKSVDGGKHWRNMGLKESEHIGRIVVDPRDSNVVYVAAQGPLWRSGGDRGLYKTTDGGKTWRRILHISDDTGINEVHMDPRDPDTLYATAYQRRRRVWTLINGGPESAIYKSTDAGKTWRKITHGIPNVDKGRIGMCISPADPDVVYAIIEAQFDKGGFFRSTDRGETWERRSGYMTTSPQYYNEIVCDPVEVDRVYALDTFMRVTEDGGKTFHRVPGKDRHVDDHALWIDPANNEHMLVGCDGGIYETYDRARNWHFKPNLPVTQFYRVSVDQAKPFYNVYGGTQDNNSQGGPSRTLSPGGIANEDWFITVGGDGYKTQVDPEDPNIVYSQWQYGGLVRHDRRSGEIVDIKPREKPGEEPYRWNWDTPLIISPHSHTRLYFAANKLFRSDDRGNSWTVISGDLTRRLDRNQLEVMGKIQSVDAVAKNRSTSIFGNAVALSESPLVEGLIYVGTDDGLIDVTEDGGKTWRRIALFPEVPDMTYVSCVYASLHDPDTVYASFDNHKNGDFKPYLLKSTDRGRNWTSITGNLPERNIVYSIQQDHEKADLLFVGTEFGAYFTLDGGKKWFKISGLPTIAVRDLDVQRRENDLAMATFGRGFYILDDYTPLRHVTEELLQKAAHVFPVKDALRYIPHSRLGGFTGRGSQGASYFTAKNPPFGAVFTYYLKEKLQTRKEKRREAEKKAMKAGKPVRYPTLEELRAEDEEKEPQVWLVVRDESGEVVRRVKGSREKGIHRAAWNLRYPSTQPISLKKNENRPPWERSPSGPLALPGTYTVTLVKEVDGQISELTEPVSFKVVPLKLATFPAEDQEEAMTFNRQVAELYRAVRGAIRSTDEIARRIAHLRKAYLETPEAKPDLFAHLHALEGRLNKLRTKLSGDRTRAKHQEPVPPSIATRISNAMDWYVTSAPTQTQRDEYRYAGEAFAEAQDELRALMRDLTALEKKFEAAHAPWTPGRLPDWKGEEP
ncbi:MAG: glycosyl hydrolase [Planctomycetota bacterium]|nr:MAG: glycosyl hydrolase [Planctomycetota bacterium]